MKNITVQPDITIRQAMKNLSHSGEKCLVIIDKENTLLGTLSDGDLRKAILKGKDMKNTIKNIYHSKPVVFIKGKYRIEEVKKIFTKNKFDLIPVVDNQGKLTDILFWETVLENGNNVKNYMLDVPIIIMAGGRGTRLEPFTKILPKALVPVHEKPIIEHIIERFTKVGCTDFHLTVNYKSGILKAYFEDLQPDYHMQFIEEQEPLGTAGSLRFLDKKFNKPFIVTNCDIIIKIDYSKLYKFHQNGGYDVTLVASAKEYIIPYGTCKLNSDGHLSHINEKPHYDFLINTGLYILNPDVLQLIPKNKFYHITHLIEDVKNQGKKVGIYPIDDDAWIDVGQWAEYQKTVEKL
jgi:dTDP-glucose pyrophosphorylase/predicted transcriptional regulator